MSKNKTRAVRNFVVDHQTDLLIGALCVMTLIAVLQRSGIKDHNRFLEAKGLLEEYYTETD